MEAAVSRIRPISAGSSSCMVSRSLRIQPMALFLRFFDDHPVLPVVLPEPDGHDLPARSGEVLADVVGANGELPVPPVPLFHDCSYNISCVNNGDNPASG